jgi:PAS domain S-box-containing protein
MHDEREELRGLRATIECAPVGIAHFGVDGRFLLVNSRLCTILGYTREELLGRTFQEITYPADQETCDALTTALHSGSIPSYRHDKRVVHNDGSVLWTRVAVSPVRDRRGSLAFFVAIVEDISAQLANEEARRQAEERLHTALDASATGTFRWDYRTYDLTWDANLDRLLGLTPGSSPQSMERFISLIHPDDRSRALETGWLCADEGLDIEQEFRIVRPDGRERWLSGKGKTFLGSDGAPQYMTGAFTDVTQRLEAERAVRKSEAKLRRIVDSGIVGVFYWTRQRDITDANDEFLRMLGYTREDLASGRLNGRTLTPARWEAIDDLRMRELTTTGVAAQWEKEFYDCTGRPVPVLVAKALLEGTTDEGIGICLDMSERKAAEIEVGRLLTREREARSQAEYAMHQRDEALAIVAHDLKNPVHTIGMIAGTLETIPLAEDQRIRQLQIIQRSASRMDHLIRDLLDISRIESGKLSIRQESVDVKRLLDDVLELFESQAELRQVALTCDVAPDVGQMVGDRDRLTQALSNLIDNALKFTPNGGRVAVRTRKVSGQIHIAVEDSGRGMPADSLAHVFDRFWQAEHASRAGAGLGLTIVKGIVEAHGGEIWVESVVGRGTTFYLTLPCADG